MTEAEVVRQLATLATGVLCNASPAVRAMRSDLAPLSPGTRIAGPARTAKITPGQNAAIHRAVHKARKGEVLVVDGQGDTSFGPFGDILATCCANQGMVGAVIDSTVRDVDEIRQMQFPVFCLGANPAATAKTDLGEIDLPISCAGVSLRPGDYIVADDDGAVVVPKHVASAVIESAGKVVAKEQSIKARLAQGETTAEILSIGIRPAAGDRATESNSGD